AGGHLVAGSGRRGRIHDNDDGNHGDDRSERHQHDDLHDRRRQHHVDNQEKHDHVHDRPPGPLPPVVDDDDHHHFVHDEDHAAAAHHDRSRYDQQHAPDHRRAPAPVDH